MLDVILYSREQLIQEYRARLVRPPCTRDGLPSRTRSITHKPILSGSRLQTIGVMFLFFQERQGDKVEDPDLPPSPWGIISIKVTGAERPNVFLPRLPSLVLIYYLFLWLWWRTGAGRGLRDPNAADHDDAECAGQGRGRQWGATRARKV
jgi:hypothetical protein